MNPTHIHIPTNTLVFPEGYDPLELKLISDEFQEQVKLDNALYNLRSERDRRLNASDRMMLRDRDLTESQFKAWKEYRQALRDITKNNPLQPIWPIEPKDI
jgi:hypothetical protein